MVDYLLFGIKAPSWALGSLAERVATPKRGMPALIEAEAGGLRGGVAPLLSSPPPPAPPPPPPPPLPPADVDAATSLLLAEAYRAELLAKGVTGAAADRLMKTAGFDVQAV